jgi:TonB-dependent SusC/RagA subfamily outer membrane receptor
MSPEKVMTAIQEQSNYNLFYPSFLLDEGKKKDLTLEKAPLTDALEAAISKQPYIYELIGKTIVLKPRVAHKGKGSFTSDKEESTASNGYQKINKKLNTGSYGEVNRKEIDERPTSSMLELISNLPGVQVQGTSIKIRGSTSFMSSTEPLIILDGVTYSTSNLNAIDPNSVQNITVLKDGAETALYGSRGANGVIVITTRRGEKPAQNNGDLGSIKFHNDGSILLNKTHVAVLMKVLSQWYQLDVIFESKSPEGNYSGRLSKDTSRDDMLQILQSAGINLKQYGQKIVITD